ncbi:hypothetical protein C8R43DRAFT_1008665 [Mycena crocata]|nr:hypothetical protein C8R43DRAFT_1008665 [Mycena crocata]
MPVTFCPSTHLATSKDVKPVTSSQILEAACPNQFAQLDRIMQYSIGGRSARADTVYKIVPNENGFVNTVMSAYSHHYALILRPDDVWLAIVSQFSFYVNANAELLRANFVAHEGKRELVVGGDSPPDFGALSRQMAELIHRNVVDPGLREWILPKFSTTTMSDNTVGCMLMMATMKKYFDYRMVALCGVPRVTLEGERHDWELLLRRLEKLKEYGLQTIAWYHLLFPVVSRFVKAFDEPNSPENFNFWQKVACGESEGSGSHYWSGWITAFCVFSTEGKWCGPRLNKEVQSRAPPESLSTRRFWSTYTRPLQETRPHLTLDHTEYPVISTDAVPSGYAEVDVIFDDNGTEITSVIVAGLVGMGFSSSRNTSVSPTGRNDTVRPVVGWWMYAKLDETERKRRREKARRESLSHAPSSPFIPNVVKPIVIVPNVESRRRETAIRSSPNVPPPPPSPSTLRWVAAQSRGGARFPEHVEGRFSGQQIIKPTSVHPRRQSESSVSPENTSSDTESVRKRRASLLKRMFKF